MKLVSKGKRGEYCERIFSLREGFSIHPLFLALRLALNFQLGPVWFSENVSPSHHILCWFYKQLLGCRRHDIKSLCVLETWLWVCVQLLSPLKCTRACLSCHVLLHQLSIEDFGLKQHNNTWEYIGYERHSSVSLWADGKIQQTLLEAS